MTRHRIPTDPTAPSGPRADAAVTIRRAVPADAEALVALAALDSARPVGGDVLVADVEGVAIAALELATDRAIADPLTPSAGAVQLLRLRAGQLDLAGAPQRRFRRRRKLAFA